MFALLGLVPVKDWIYGGIIAALLAGFGWYTLHERSVGAQKVVSADTKAAAVAEKRDAAITATAQAASTQIGNTYAKDLDTPVVAPPHVLCERPASTGSELPQTSSGAGGADGAPAVPGPGQVDIGPPLVAVGSDADDQVRALQAEIQVLLDAMNGVAK
jgi:hypothetical protein